MDRRYNPNLAGFAEKLGLKNGVYDLIKKPIPQQEILYLRQDDINGKIQSGKTNRRQGKNYHKGVKRR